MTQRLDYKQASPKGFAAMLGLEQHARTRSLSDLEIVGCKSTAAVHFSPSFCPIAGLWAC